ncbi:MAG: glycosyltransferase family 2 protein [Armatimonadota bacterium]
MSISVLILTRNEEVNLPGCLASTTWSDDVVVLDSYSTDSTPEIARAAGACFIQREFDNYSAHREWALREIPYKYPWVLSLDADERCTPDLVTEMQESILNAPDEVTLFLLRRKDHFWGKWIRHSSSYPVWFERLYRPDWVWMNPRMVNEHMETDGEVRRLSGHLIHHPFNRGVRHWLDRHNQYSSMEAVEYLQQVADPGIAWQTLFTKDPIQRRLALKNMAVRLPYRPWLKFFYLFILRRGFLDGMPGLTYCTLQAVYEYMIELKVREIKRREQGLPI